MNMRIAIQPIILVMVVGCTSAPDLANDPRTGGLAGVVAGELRGDYDARVQEREARRNRLSALEEQLKGEQQDLEQAKQVKAQRLNVEQAKLARLERDTQGLRRTVSRLEGRTGAIEIRKRALLSKINDLGVKIEQTKTSDEDETLRERKRLERELSERSKEYELLRKRNELLLP